MELTQVRLLVSDFPAAVRFYADVLGLPPQFPDPQPPYAAFKPEQGGTLALHDRAELDRALGGALRPAGDGALVALRVDDLDAYLAEITTRGATVLSGPVDLGRLRAAYLRDPEGNLIELQQWLATR
jgi:lactoylglutathione lyase